MSEDEKTVDAITEMEQAIQRAEENARGRADQIPVDRDVLCRFLSESIRLKQRIEELMTAGSRLVRERQDMDRDQLSIAEKVRKACAAECAREVSFARERASDRGYSSPHYDRSDGQRQGAEWCEKHVLELDLAKVLGS
jgi:hypothetical protein